MTEDTPSHLDYDDLVARYNTGLVDNLRSFGFHTDYLDMWVPDEDVARSLLNLMEAAATVGCPALSLRLGAESLASLDFAGFEAAAAGRGRVVLTREGQGAILSVTELRAPAATVVAVNRTEAKRAADTAVAAAAIARPLLQPQDLAPLYSAAIAALAAAVPAPVCPPANAIKVTAQRDGLVLDAWIEPQTHIIRAVAHHGARSPAARGLAEAMAQAVMGLPVLEAADHGMIRVEFTLRGHIAHRPVAGIVTPEAADPAFALGSALLRDLLAEYRRVTGFAEIHNDFDPGPGPAWMAADEDTRRRMLTDALAADGFPLALIDISAIEYHVRVVLSLSGELGADAARALVALERCIKRRVDDRLELFLSELKDSNQTRRLSEQGAEKP
ncbi:MAG: hypothetical protein H7Y60_01770 [Rhodospirillaceae bacterium]|nr:hypothetical protein [Rhodospirillales bacterium]